MAPYLNSNNRWQGGRWSFRHDKYIWAATLIGTKIFSAGVNKAVEVSTLKSLLFQRRLGLNLFDCHFKRYERVLFKFFNNETNGAKYCKTFTIHAYFIADFPRLNFLYHICKKVFFTNSRQLFLSIFVGADQIINQLRWALAYVPILVFFYSHSNINICAICASETFTTQILTLYSLIPHNHIHSI